MAKRSQTLSSKRARRSKSKGRRGQRVAAKAVSLWWTGDPDSFVSTPGSGSLRWKQGVGKVTADIVQANENFPDFPFSVEVKNHEDWSIMSILKGSAEFNHWWDQCCTDARRATKRPMLLFTKNHAPLMIALPGIVFSIDWIPDGLNRLKLPKNYVRVKITPISLATLRYLTIYVTEAEKFFELNPPIHMEK